MEHARAMAEAAGHVSRIATGQSQSVEGSVRLSVTQGYAVHLLPGMLRRLRDKAPGLEVEIVASNETSDLRRREADMAIRHAQPQDPELIGRRLRDHAAAFYATREYLASIPPLNGPADFVHAKIVGLDDDARLRDALLAMGVAVGERPFPYRTADHNAHWALALEGLALGIVDTVIGDAEPKAVRAAPWLPAFPFPVWLVAHRELATSRRIRLVFDHLAEE
ncbi:MAG: substrate-binding domain-containing protein, partial [Pseudomonadota bacterium]